MADYNIYLRTVVSGTDTSFTTPFQLTSGGDAFSVDGSGFNPSWGNGFRTAARAIGYIGNPDSMIGSVMGMASGVLSKAGWVAVIIAAAKLTVQCVELYNSVASVNSGDFGGRNRYNNFKQVIHNVFNPFSTQVEKQQNIMAERRETLKNQQDMLLYGGTILNNRNGRYL